MINAVIAIALEAYLEHNSQIEAVHDRGQLLDGCALYLRYENERGHALAQWLCAPPPETSGGLSTASQFSSHTPFSNLLTKHLAYPAASNLAGRWRMEHHHVAPQTDRRGDLRHLSRH